MKSLESFRQKKNDSCCRRREPRPVCTTDNRKLTESQNLTLTAGTFQNVNEFSSRARQSEAVGKRQKVAPERGGLRSGPQLRTSKPGGPAVIRAAAQPGQREALWDQREGA